MSSQRSWLCERDISNGLIHDYDYGSQLGDLGNTKEITNFEMFKEQRTVHLVVC